MLRSNLEFIMEVDKPLSIHTTSDGFSSKPKMHKTSDRTIMKSYFLKRLATFSSYRNPHKSFMIRSSLSKAGFSYTGIDGLIRCQECKVEMDTWDTNIDVLKEHSRLSPSCQFAIEYEIRTSNSAKKIGTSTTENKMDYSIIALSDELDDTLSSDEQKMFFKSHPTEKIIELCARTFSHWPFVKPSTTDMVNAGWWYTNLSDRVICLQCHVVFHKWTENIQPFEIHRKASPMCPYVRNIEKNLTNSKVLELTIDQQTETFQTATPKHTNYRDPISRQKTFEAVPVDFLQELPSIESFVEAGFFYTGTNRICKCFFCDGALQNWSKSTDPKIEHARWFPYCTYIQQSLGEDLFQAIQRKHQLEKNAGNFSPANELGVLSQFDLDRMVKSRLDLPMCEHLKKKGYQTTLLKRIIEQQLKLKKDDFKTEKDMQIAYFILEQQIKVINGKPNNILVAEEFLQNPQCRTMNVEKIKSSEPLRNSLAVSKHDSSKIDDTNSNNLCVICSSNERQVACMPCGHFCSCAVCGFGFNNCPICRANVKGYVRIYS